MVRRRPLAEKLAVPAVLLLCASTAVGQSSSIAPLTPSAGLSPSISNDRIIGVIPNFQTVEDPEQPVQPLTVEQKFGLFYKETVDPFTAVAAAAGAALSQAGNGDPKYGRGSGAYGKRFAAAVADVSTQNFFSDAVMASILHEDPRYFRRGSEYGLWQRVGYALSRVVITHTDAGTRRFSYSQIIGMGIGIGLSNSYYPAASVNGREVASRFGTSLAALALTNLMGEFWPDLRPKLHRILKRGN
jgi:hypothetical protein